MTDEPGTGGVDSMPRRVAEAAAALDGLREPAERAAASIESAFDRAGSSLTRSLARAAADGEVSLAELARAVLAAVNAAAGGRAGGLSGAIAQAAGSIFAGARAEGGPVAAGGAYLVGERGPELFRPGSSGVIDPPAAGSVTVNVLIEGGAEALLRSEAQIAQALARAVSLGARRL
ncbi:phage tail tape measure protein [Brevundimonas sp.]|uniref:phage tail tape measure protein n=1 Tax=Brevundimonas sp. TaxID=1871086 RepID=UPI002ED8CAAB